jgi:hypothetical protein
LKECGIDCASRPYECAFGWLILRVVTDDWQRFDHAFNESQQLSMADVTITPIFPAKIKERNLPWRALGESNPSCKIENLES